ncbi:MAG: MBL fold metallo-hydrolase [Burkholderiales bacterium]|nr:MBL fold metallo-hydrolase [Burkholderiales bacterium]
MKIRFWGTRGSIPIALTAPAIRAKIVAALAGTAGRTLDSPQAIERYVDEELSFDIRGTFGGHSSCVELAAGAEPIIFDFGSGARPLGQSMLERHGGAAQTYHVFMSHVHWDHIMGFPFFAPVYIPGNRIVIHGCHAVLEQAFRRQQAAPSFPVDFSQLAARIEFDLLVPGKRYRIAGVDVTPKLQRHEGDSYGYRIEAQGRCVVYSTDSEHKVDDIDERQAFIEFFRGADVVIFDAMYALADAISVKADWGHSSNIVGVELCQAAGVRRLCMYHHEPAYDDARIAAVLQETRRFEEITRSGARLEVVSAYDGLELDV